MENSTSTECFKQTDTAQTISEVSCSCFLCESLQGDLVQLFKLFAVITFSLKGYPFIRSVFPSSYLGVILERRLCFLVQHEDYRALAFTYFHRKQEQRSSFLLDFQ